MTNSSTPYARLNQPAPPPPGQAPQGNWWSRNWKWLVPVGCLLPVICCCGCFSLATIFGLNVLKSTPPYVQSLKMVQEDNRVTAALGTPIEPAFLVMGQYNMVNGTANADLTYNVSGPNGKATVHVIATQTSDGSVNFTTLDVTILSTGEQIDLFDREPQVAPPTEADPAPAGGTSGLKSLH